MADPNWFVKEDYETTGIEIGSKGGFGRVTQFQITEEGRVKKSLIPKFVALKVTKVINGEKEDDLLKICQHKNVLQLLFHEVLVFPNMGEYLHLYTEFCDQDLRHYMNNTNLTDKEVMTLSRQLVEVCQFLHDEKGIVHRDIKPENILVNTRCCCSPTGVILKLADFGFARHMESIQVVNDSFHYTFCGTRDYASPEVLKGENSMMVFPMTRFATDVFSLGVVIFEMATKKRPFTQNELRLTSNQWKMKKFLEEGNLWKLIRNWKRSHVEIVVRENIKEPSLVKVLTNMLCFDPKKRIESKDALQYFVLPEI